jgi:hypothetical protein
VGIFKRVEGKITFADDAVVAAEEGGEGVAEFV